MGGPSSDLPVVLRASQRHHSICFYCTAMSLHHDALRKVSMQSTEVLRGPEGLGDKQSAWVTMTASGGLPRSG